MYFKKLHEGLFHISSHVLPEHTGKVKALVAFNMSHIYISEGGVIIIMKTLCP